ncbi:hypothetical protein ACO2Q3_20090 [Caulobacter sp. KR2-114]|uniref:hypothetical protein n=1 Tax=Caulobacter sp. KR2-114 TaxID=3400912 RepID=UPI003C0285D7
MAAVDTTQTRTAAARRYDLRVGAACALAGAALFSLLTWRMGFGYGGAWDPRAAWVLTPVFLAPLLICLVRAGRLGIGGAIALTLALTVVHFNAIAVVAFGYKQQTDDSLWHMLDKSQAYWTAANARHAAQRVIAEHSALVGGRKAGAIGAFVSFALLLPFGRGFRRPSSLAAMLVAGVALTFWGGVALTRTLPEAMTPADYALWLFLPWQGLFGLVLAWAFVARGAKLSG